MHINIGTESKKFMREAYRATLRAFGLLFVGGRHDPQDLLLIRPNQSPDIEQHNGAEPGADANDEVGARTG